MICAFQDHANLYLVMDLLTGGDLRYNLSKYKVFTEPQTSKLHYICKLNNIEFIIACTLLALEYIHSNNIIHCDIKPENLISDSEGYVRVTDFGSAKINNNKTNVKEINITTTPGYTAPEVICAQSYSFLVDYYAIGVVCYECMLGCKPYTGKTRKEIKQAMLRKQASVTKEMLPHTWSSVSMDFVNKCIQRKEIKRLGYQQGITELKQHPWFNDIDWKRLYNKTIQPPFTITSEHNYDKKHCESVDVLSPDTIERYNLYMQKDNYNSLFSNYNYIDNLYVYNSYNNSNNQDNTNFNARGTRITFVKEVNELKDTVKDNEVKCNVKPSIKKYESGLNVKKGLFDLGVGYLNKKYLNVSMLNKKGGFQMNNKIIPYFVKPSCDNSNSITSDLPNININMNGCGSKFGKNNFYRVNDTKKIASLKKGKGHSNNNSISITNNESMFGNENRMFNQSKRDCFLKKIKNSHSLSGMIHSQNISYC